MGRFVDLTGQRFGLWSVITRVENTGIVARWRCVCSCGTERVVRGMHLVSGASRCCGCERKPAKHGHAVSGKRFSKKYRTWRYIRARCLNPNHKNANIYHGLLCSQWLEFLQFDADVPNPPSDEYTIDRIENSKGYEPGNVRWVLFAEQHRNQSNCRWIVFDGRRMLLTDWARSLGISVSGLYGRIKRNGVQKALGG